MQNTSALYNSILSAGLAGGLGVGFLLLTCGVGVML